MERLRNFVQDKAKQEGKIGYIIFWLLGVPIPLLILVALLRGCA